MIPKIETPTDIKDFRPISLLHSIPKLICKVLALRLKQKIMDLIDQMQSGFITKRSITENFLLASELVQCALKRNKPMIVLKLDFHKAFDTINWEFLLYVLQHRCFDSRWSDWIRSILSTSKAHILINGAIGDQIQYKRGVRQGDPLSPYLFILVPDVLQRLIKQAGTNGRFSHPLDI